MDIEDAQPLYNEAYLEDIWPCLKLCSKKRDAEFRIVLMHCFHKELGIKVSANEYSRNQQEDEELTMDK